LDTCRNGTLMARSRAKIAHAGQSRLALVGFSVNAMDAMRVVVPSSPRAWGPEAMRRVAGNQRHASAHTIASYRDTWRLLLAFANSRTGIPPSQLDLADVDAELVAAFLDHLETACGNNTRTRSARLAAIHSLFRYAALAHPEHAKTIARVLAIPVKRTDRALVTFLTVNRSPRPDSSRLRLGRRPAA
jgi:Phage integrase, N-terminal SAM-like domain